MSENSSLETIEKISTTLDKKQNFLFFFLIMMSISFAVSGMLLYYRIPPIHIAYLLGLLLACFLIAGFMIKKYLFHLGSEIKSFKSMFHKLLSETKRIQDLRAQDKTIRQIIHDMKAPLAALKTISRQGESIENDILASSINRINHITTELFQKQATLQRGTITHFELAIMDVLNEKALTEKDYIKIKTDFHGVKHSYIKIDTSSFQRAISNLIDNAIDALKKRYQGNIEIRAIELKNSIEITIEDNGCGIPKDILEKLRVKGFSYKKKDGHGLGLEYARKTIRNFGGNLKLHSVLGVGTTLVITLSKCLPPEWLCETIDVYENPDICVIDDVLSMHQVWKRKFQLSLGSFRLKSLFIPDNEVPVSDLYIVDYEFENSPSNGIDFIKKHQLKNAYLCTAHYENKDIQDQCLEYKIKVIPKDFISKVSFNIILRNPKEVVHIDDDPLMRMIWKKAAKKQGLLIKSLAHPRELEGILPTIPRGTPFYIDQNLQDGIKGTGVAKRLYEQGCHNLFISSGYGDEEFCDLPYVKKSVGKTPPENLIPGAPSIEDAS